MFIEVQIYKHFVMMGSLATNLRILEILIYTFSTKIDTHEYKWNHSIA